MMLVAFLVLCAVGIVTSTAQSTQKEERELEDRIPKHLPIKVKVKNLNSEKWTRDIEIEVTNTGNKPIYYLRLGLLFMDVKGERGNDLSFTFRYGRPELYVIENRANPEDVPIQPGETYVIRSPQGLAAGWEKFRGKYKKSHPKKLGIEFHALNYGDGTGFETLGGLPVLPPRASKSSCGGQRSADNPIPAPLNALLSRPPRAPVQFLSSSLPVSYLPAMLFPAKISETAYSPSTPQSGLCCPGTSCFKMRSVLGGNCHCPDDPPVSTEDVHDCSASGQCGTQVAQDSICDSEGHTCTNFFIRPCNSPDPTPTPTPTPCATPDPETRPNPSCYPFGPCPPQGTQGWMCATCSDGIVSYPAYPQTNGCPDGYYNNGQNCCVSNNPPPTPTPGDGCVPGYNESGEYCSCPQPEYACADQPQTTCPYATVHPCGATPVLVDVLGDGFSLTGLAGGVAFDIDGNPDGVRERVSWTRAGSDDAWLALDRDGDGAINSGRELFGNYTWQPRSPERNGFLALAEYDKPPQGGNADGVIDKKDAVFANLRLWGDANHNGVSEPGELRPAGELGLAAFDLKYRESKRTDEHGNQFKYRAQVKDLRGAQAGRWAWDVILVTNAP
jgi:hypothetical protein